MAERAIWVATIKHGELLRGLSASFMVGIQHDFLLDYLSYLEKVKLGLSDHHALCVSVFTPCPINL
jgi:hypothetical protein